MLTFTNQSTGEGIANHIPGDDDPFTRQGAIVAITSYQGQVAMWRVTGPTIDGVIPVVAHDAEPIGTPAPPRRTTPEPPRPTAPAPPIEAATPAAAEELDDSPWEVAAREIEAAKRKAAENEAAATKLGRRNRPQATAGVSQKTLFDGL